MATDAKVFSGFQVNRKMVAAGLMLGGCGAAAGLLGTVMVGVALANAGRTWARQLEVPPSERAARTLAQARAASQAGLDAWRSAAPAN
ncbi:hypothetical protein ACFW1A_02250 [Kitasatospora sp. NPDC058965]|uniref:hypothetical protein n=1 Tax=Kitasatospora sp. NPDC058965 TaxID=3346682 RepID=UPI003693DF68